jgi:hypothetical protein
MLALKSCKSCSDRGLPSFLLAYIPDFPSNTIAQTHKIPSRSFGRFPRHFSRWNFEACKELLGLHHN